MDDLIINLEEDFRVNLPTADEAIITFSDDILVKVRQGHEVAVELTSQGVQGPPGAIGDVTPAAIAARDKAQLWAERTVDAQVETGKYSAKHHASKAADSAGVASGHATTATNQAAAAAQSFIDITNAIMTLGLPSVHNASSFLRRKADNSGFEYRTATEVRSDIGAQSALSSVTQADAEAGTSTTTRLWTALRVRQAIAAYAATKVHTHEIAEINGLLAALDALAAKASPEFTGTPTAPTAALATNNTQIATTEFVQLVVSDMIAGAPGALDTLNELAAALGDDPNFATTMTSALAQKMATADFTGANILSLLLGVDGAGSSLDADQLDGQEGSYYRNASNLNAGTVADGRLPSSMSNKTLTDTITLNGHIDYSGITTTLLTTPNDASWRRGLYHQAVGPGTIAEGAPMDAFYGVVMTSYISNIRCFQIAVQKPEGYFFVRSPNVDSTAWGPWQRMAVHGHTHTAVEITDSGVTGRALLGAADAAAARTIIGGSANLSTVSQADAEAGTSSTARQWTALRVRQNVASYAAPIIHVHAIADVTGLQEALDGMDSAPLVGRATGTVSVHGITDWNSVVTPGHCPQLMQGTQTNGPGGAAYYYLEVKTYSVDQIVQIAHPYSLDISPTPAVSVRTRYSGTWSAWRQLYGAEDTPAFYAGNCNSNLSNSFITFHNVYANRGNCYNVSNGRFTATVKGHYEFAAALFINTAAGPSAWATMRFYKNETIVSNTFHTTWQVSRQYETLNGHIVVPMEAGDFVRVRFSGASGAVTHGDAYNHFSGHLIG